MRRDAADALAYGCSGLLGIHWRTRVLGPNVSALAKAAWDQKPWNPYLGKEMPIPDPKRTEGREGGNVAAFPNNPIADTEQDALYQTVTYGMKAYRLKVAEWDLRRAIAVLRAALQRSGQTGLRRDPPGPQGDRQARCLRHGRQEPGIGLHLPRRGSRQRHARDPVRRHRRIPVHRGLRGRGQRRSPAGSTAAVPRQGTTRPTCPGPISTAGREICPRATSISTGPRPSSARRWPSLLRRSSPGSTADPIWGSASKRDAYLPRPVDLGRWSRRDRARPETLERGREGVRVRG